MRDWIRGKHLCAIQPQEGTESVYPGTCRSKGIPVASGYGIRIKIEDRKEEFNDAFLGLQIHCPARQCGDFLIKDRRGNYTYNFCVAVDDIRHDINLTVRGRDLLFCTGRQIALKNILKERKEHLYLHHPLLFGDDGKKLGKRFFSEGVAFRREAGETPSKILGEALYLANVVPKKMQIKASEITKIILSG